MGNGKRSTSQPGETRRKRAKGLRRAGPSISDADRHRYKDECVCHPTSQPFCSHAREVVPILTRDTTNRPSTCRSPLSHHQNPEPAGQGDQLGAPAAAVYSQTSPSTPAPTTVSPHHEEYGAEPRYYGAPQAAYGDNCCSASNHAHDTYGPAEEDMDAARASIIAAQGSVHGYVAKIAGSQPAHLRPPGSIRWPAQANSSVPPHPCKIEAQLSGHGRCDWHPIPSAVPVAGPRAPEL